MFILYIIAPIVTTLWLLAIVIIIIIIILIVTIIIAIVVSFISCHILSSHVMLYIFILRSGLILIDVTNVTMRELFFRKWAKCAENIDCLSPNNTRTEPGFFFEKKYYYYDKKLGKNVVFQ